MEVIIPAHAERSVGNLEPAWFNNNQGQVEMLFSDVTGVTVAVVQN